MTLSIKFEHDYQHKILKQEFEDTAVIRTEDDVQQWRQIWLDALKSWHSPYKAVIDGRRLQLDAAADVDSLKKAFLRMEKVLSGFFLKKAVVFGCDPEFAAILPFDSFAQEEQAWEAVGQRRSTQKADPTDFRGSIQLQNHFRQHVVELNFSQPVLIDSKEKLQVLRSKLTNNLMQWHSAWNLLIDCSQLSIAPELFADFEQMQKFFHGFFLKETLGYQPHTKDEGYPFKVYRARHNAAGRLEAEGLFSGEDANCRTRKPEKAT